MVMHVSKTLYKYLSVCIHYRHFYAFTLLLCGFGWLDRDKMYKATTIENDMDLF